MKTLSKYKFKSSLVLILSLVSSFFLVFSGYCLAGLLDNVIDLNGDKLIRSSLLLLFMWGAYIVFNHLNNIAKSKLRLIIKNDLRYELSLQITHDKFKSFLGKNDEFISWYNNDLDKIDSLYLDGTFKFITNLFNLVFAALAIAKINILLLIIVSIMSLIMFIVPKKLSSKLNDKMMLISKESENFVKRLSDLNAGLLEFLSFNKLDKYSKLIKDSSNEYEKTKSAYEIYASLIESIITAVTLSFQMGLIIFTGILAFLEYIQVGFIMSIANLSGNFLSSVSSLLSLYPKIVSGKNIYLKHNQEVNHLVFNENIVEKLELKNVSYHIGDKTIFNNISFEILKGEKILLDGESGSGKSTLLNIIYGLIDNYGGEIKLNGKNIKEFDIACDIGYLRQEPHFFNDSITANLEYFDINLNNTDLVKELKLLDMFKQDRVDATYSGGEKQKLMCLRQLLSKQSLILVDEVTSSLDKDNRDLVFNALMNSDKTIIYVAHNLENNQYALFDKVINL